MTHDSSHWHENIWFYHPIDYPIEKFYEQNKEFIDKIASLGNEILEVGCGTALMSLAIKQKYRDKHIVATDINRIVAHMARTRIFYWQLDVKCGYADGFNLPFSDQSYDVIFHEGVLEHYDETEIIKMLNEHLRVAKYVVIYVPTDLDLAKGGGYGDERSHSYEWWSNFMKQNFNVKEEFGNEDKYECVIEK